jgi:uncharacterized YceG family protein
MTPRGDDAKRSAEERERARLERERRRAARMGMSPDEVDALPDPTIAVPPPIDSDPGLIPPPDPVAANTPDENEPVDALTWEDPSQPVQAGPDPSHEPEPDIEPPDRPQDDIIEPDPQPAVRVLADREGERPAGVRRVSGSAVASAAGAEGSPRFGAPPRGKPRRRRGSHRVAAVVGLGVVVVLGWFLISLFQPGKGDGSGRVHVVIPQGAGARSIGNLLADKGVVSSGMFFALRARLGGDRENLRAGPHDLKKDMSYGAALKALTTTAPAPVLAKITIPEGRTALQTVPLVKAAGLRGGYMGATRHQHILHPRTFGAKKGTKSVEGLLFPATYTLKPGSPASDLVDLQLKAFKKNIKLVDMRKARKKNLTIYDVVTIASMIENEAEVPSDRRLIAAVMYNRLHQHIPLGIDATTRYETGNYDRPITASELRRNNGYNTRTHQGLPPTPISNPGLASLRAAANPANVPYIYYVVKPCGNGAHTFATTDAEFQKAVAAYNRKRDQLGGKDPSHC